MVKNAPSTPNYAVIRKWKDPQNHRLVTHDILFYNTITEASKIFKNLPQGQEKNRNECNRFLAKILIDWTEGEKSVDPSKSRGEKQYQFKSCRK